MQKRLRSIAAVLLLIGSASLTGRAQDWDRAVSLFNQKQYRQSIKEFHGLLRANPDYYQAWYYVGAGHFQLQEFEEAIDPLVTYVKAADKDEKGQATGYYFIGFSYFQLKQYDQAIPAFNKHVALAEKLQQKPEPAARAALGRSYVFTEKYAEAIPALTAAAADNKTDTNNYYYLAFAQQKLGRSDQAIAALNQGLAINAKDPEMLLLLGSIYLTQARQNPAALKQAVNAGERLLAVQDDEKAWNLLGQAYLFDQQYAKAAPLLDKFARLHADVPGAWYNLGLALSRTSQWKPAATALEKAATLAPKNVAALLELGYVYESDKLSEKALTAYERAYEASGRSDPTARDGIERLKNKPKPVAQR